MNLALRCENGSKFGALSYLQVLYAYLFDIVVFKSEIKFIEIIGATLIIGINFSLGLLRLCNFDI